MSTSRDPSLPSLTSTSASGCAGAGAGEDPAVGTLREEVAALRRALADRERQLAELSLIHDSMGTSISLCRVEGPDRFRMLIVNRGALSMARMTAEQVVGRMVHENVSPEVFQAILPRLRAVVETRQVQHWEARSVFDPELRLENRWVPILAEDGHCSHILFENRDVTALRNAQEKLQHAAKMEAVGQLAGGVAHDFNNLLTAILGNAELALRQADVPQLARHFLQEITRCAELSATVTAQLLAFSRKAVLVPRVLDINALVRDSREILRRLIGEAIELQLVLLPEPVKVRIDPTQFIQVLINLAANARDAMPTGGTLTIQTSMPQRQDGARVRLTVKDTGVGMKSAVRRRIFEPFFTTKGPGRGTGLGLASAHGVIEQSGGRITVTSKPGQGTTFHIDLPIEVERSVPAISPEALAPIRPGRESVLVVEDDEPVRVYVQQALELAGYRVLCAGDGRLALQVLGDQSRPVDLLLTDVVVPHLTGPALARSGRALRPQLKTLYMTGHAQHALVDEALADCGAAMLRKPFGPVELDQALRRCLGPV